MKFDNNRMAYGLFYQRVHAEMSYELLSKLTGISEPHIYSLEHQKREITTEELINISYATGWAPSEIMGTICTFCHFRRSKFFASRFRPQCFVCMNEQALANAYEAANRIPYLEAKIAKMKEDDWKETTLSTEEIFDFFKQ
jgi:predicted DNA-binding transcriptional regulator AlpA